MFFILPSVPTPPGCVKRSGVQVQSAGAPTSKRQSLLWTPALSCDRRSARFPLDASSITTSHPWFARFRASGAITSTSLLGAATNQRPFFWWDSMCGGNGDDEHEQMSNVVKKVVSEARSDPRRFASGCEEGGILCAPRSGSTEGRLMRPLR